VNKLIRLEESIRSGFGEQFLVKAKYKCIICGRVFPKGQGIVINYGNFTIPFHSSRCAAKFLKRLLEEIPREDIGKHVKRLYEDLLEELKKREELKAKRI